MPRITMKQALARVPADTDNRFATVFANGPLEVEVYAPRGRDPQQPHSRNEVYVVMKGRSMFVDGADRYPVSSGDMIFVPAGVVHRFEDFSDDLAVWVFFYGPNGEAHGAPEE